MKKTLFISLLAFAAAIVIYAAQDTTLSNRQVRDPVQLEAILEANATDAETRLDALEGIYVDSKKVTSTNTALQTNVFNVVFSAAPVVVCTYTEDPGDVRPIFVTATTTTNFICSVTADKNFQFIAVGTK
jgi:hypothetical protein